MNKMLLEEQQIIILENTIKNKHKDLINPKVFKTKYNNIFSIVDAKNIYFTNYENSFFIIGTLYENDESFKDYNKTLRAKYNSFYLEKLDKKQLYKYEALEEKDYVFVFTDPTCPFCKRLHDNIDFFNENGISIYYIPFPRNGRKDVNSINALNEIICSDNAKSQFDLAFKNINLYLNKNLSKSCDYSNVIWSYYALADILDIKGTPAVFTKNGFLVGGFNNKINLLNKINEFSNYGN